MKRATCDFPTDSPPTPQPEFQEIDLGPIEQHAPIQSAIVAGRACFRIRDEKRVRLLSASCPHMGGEVRDIGPHLECPLHGWTFDKSTGQCLNAPNAALSEIETFERDGRLFARLPRRHVIHREAKTVVDNLSIELIAHSSLAIRRSTFTLITDPWLNGPAMLGSWTQYPPPVAKLTDLRPDAIWISHEHSDHFHEPTLRALERSTPIYFPDFPNERIKNRLTVLGFTNIHPMPFGQRIEIAPNFFLTCYEPASLWNDAIVLIEIDGFRLLNLNDAGLNRRIANIIGPVDAVASAFTPGASGYPLTWTHISQTQQDTMLERSCTGMLEMLREAVKLYGCNALIPYAGHFALAHPLHRKHVRRMKKNTLPDVKNALAEMPVEVIDLLPGESWHPATSDIRRSWKNRDKLSDLDRIEKYLDRNFDQQTFLQHHGNESISAEQLDEHFLKLNAVPEIIFCEDLSVRVIATDLSTTDAIFQRQYDIRAGKISVATNQSSPANLTMRVPATVLAKIIRDDLSWDESHIGYWCTFSRSPDIFHGGFWRLLQAPYYRRAVTTLPTQLRGTISPNTSVANIVETHGPHAERILRRYGLYCAGCHRATAETLAQAAATHGIDSVQTQRLIEELNSALIGKSQ